MKYKIYSKLIILLALVLCLAACDGAVHLPGIINSIDPIVTVSVKYDANGGTGNMDDQIVEQNVATKLSSNSFSRNGYSFDGWNTKSDGTGTSYSNEELATIVEDLTLYAMWDGKVYQVKYEFSHNLDSTADVLFPFTNDSYKNDIVFRYCKTTTNATGIYGSDYSYEKYTKFSEHFSLESYSSPVTYYVPLVTTYKSGVGVETNTLPDSNYIEKDSIYSNGTTFNYTFVDWSYKDASDNIKPLNKISGYSIIPDEDYDAIIANSEYVILYATFNKATTGK